MADSVTAMKASTADHMAALVAVLQAARTVAVTVGKTETKAS